MKMENSYFAGKSLLFFQENLMTGNFVFPAVEKFESCIEYNFPVVFVKTGKLGTVLISNGVIYPFYCLPVYLFYKVSFSLEMERHLCSWHMCMKLDMNCSRAPILHSSYFQLWLRRLMSFEIWAKETKGLRILKIVQFESTKTKRKKNCDLILISINNISSLLYR